jgi:hypothetical protein
MITEENISILIQICTLVGIVFGVYLYFRRPQEKGEITDALFAEKINFITERFETKFQDMKDGVVKIMQNDMQELKSDVREHVKNQIINEREVASNFSKMFTLIDERLPKK